MKINNKPPKKSVRVALILLVALLALGVCVYAFYPRDSSRNDTEQVKSSDQTGMETTPKAEKEDAAVNKSDDVDTNVTTNEVPQSTTITTSITLLEQKNNQVEYRATVSGASNATCSATFTSQLGKPVVRTSQASNGVCSENINATAFDALGEWQLQLRVYSENAQATDTKAVTIR